MAKVMILEEVSKEIAEAIKAGRHPLTEDWNQPGYLARDEWDRMGSELEKVVEARALRRAGDLKVQLANEIETAKSLQDQAAVAILANAKELADTKSLLAGEQAKVTKLTEDLAVERTTLQQVRGELVDIANKPGAPTA